MTRDVAVSIRARLLARARADGEEFERTLVRYAGERLLYRLGASSARERCLLKGASLLSVWLPDPHRATRDVDLLAFGAADEEAIRALVQEVCAVPCTEDGLLFDLAGLGIDDIRAEEEYSGKRARFQAFLARARITLQLDIGTGDAVGPEREEVELAPMLAGLPPARILAYPREASVAEKFEAMLKLDTRNSRMKDFHDVWALASNFHFHGPTLQQAVDRCFERRRSPWTEERPRPLTPTFYHVPEMEARWRAYLNAGSILVPPPARFGEVGEAIVRFLGPVRDAVVRGHSLEANWQPGGPWQPREQAASGGVRD